MQTDRQAAGITFGESPKVRVVRFGESPNLTRMRLQCNANDLIKKEGSGCLKHGSFTNFQKTIPPSTQKVTPSYGKKLLVPLFTVRAS
jgi:hypothetical protein